MYTVPTGYSTNYKTSDETTLQDQVLTCIEQAGHLFMPSVPSLREPVPSRLFVVLRLGVQLVPRLQLSS